MFLYQSTIYNEGKRGLMHVSEDSVNSFAASIDPCICIEKAQKLGLAFAKSCWKYAWNHVPASGAGCSASLNPQ